MKNRFCCLYLKNLVTVNLCILVFFSKVHAQTGCATKPDGSQPLIAIPPSQAVSNFNSNFNVQRLSEKISDILINNHCFRVIDPNTVISKLREVEPDIRNGYIDPSRASRDGQVLGNDFFFQGKIESINENWARRTDILAQYSPQKFKYSFKIEFRFSILCTNGVFGYSHFETVEFNKNVNGTRDVPSERDAKIDEMLQTQCRLLQADLANILLQCQKGISEPKKETDVQIKLTSISYDQYNSVDDCLRQQTKFITIVKDNAFRNNQGNIDIKLDNNNVRWVIGIIGNCIKLKVLGVQENLIELSGQ